VDRSARRRNVGARDPGPGLVESIQGGVYPNPLPPAASEATESRFMFVSTDPTSPEGRKLIGISVTPSTSIDPAWLRGASAAVVLPTLNEREGLARTLSKLPLERFADAEERIRTLVVDGGSTDGTLDVAREWGIPVMRQTGRGKGGAVIEAITLVQRLGVPFAVVLDADATYPPDRILPALQLLKGGTDLVIGVRRPVWGPPSDLKDLVHRVGNILFSYTSSLLARRSILDLCSGFWGVSTARFIELDLDDSGFAIEAELVLKSIHRGLSVHQIPVDYFERVGQAKLRALRDGGKILATILRNGRPGPVSVPPRQNSAPLGRDLLSIGLALGLTGALLECAPSGAPEAGQIAHYLQRSLPQTQVRIGIRGSEPIAGGDIPHRSRRRGVPESQPSLPPFLVSLPSAEGGAGLNRQATVLIRSERGRMTIELPAATATTPGRRARSSPATPRDRRILASSTGTSSPSLRILTSRLNFHPSFQQATLLTANGFHIRETPPK
jgi:hypothetical protein